MIGKNGRKWLVASLIAALSVAPLSVGIMSEKAVYAETEATVSKQYECDAQGNPVDGAAGTSRYYKEEISGSQTVYISNACKNQYIDIEVKNPNTDIKIEAFDASSGLDEEGYRSLSYCHIFLMDADKNFLEQKNPDPSDPQEYYLFTGLAEGSYKIVVNQWLQPSKNESLRKEGYEELVDGLQEINYTLYCVVDRQAQPSATPVNSTPPQTTEAPTQTDNNLSDNAGKSAPSVLKNSSAKNNKSKKKLSLKGLTVKKNSKKITGTTMAKAKIKAKINGKIYQVKANRKGKFCINLKKKLKKNAKIKVQITLKNYKSYTKTIKVK